MPSIGAGQKVAVDVEKVQTSCGYAVAVGGEQGYVNADIAMLIGGTKMRKRLHKLTFILKVRQSYILQTRI